jgi:hypothetical protein
MKSLGVQDVVGVDLSAHQIGAALAAAEGDPGPCPEFIVQDAGCLAGVDALAGRFDLVNASWLYDTAPDHIALHAMARSSFSCLRPGGIHVGIDLNFGLLASSETEREEFGVALMVGHPPGTAPSDGETFRAEIAVGNPRRVNGLRTLRTDVVYYGETSYREAFEAAGFEAVSFTAPSNWRGAVSVLSADDARMWNRYVAANPEMMSFVGRRPDSVP